MNIQMLPIKNLIPYENNPRINGDAVASVAASIKEFGFQQPIVVNKEMQAILKKGEEKTSKKATSKTSKKKKK